MAGGFAHLSVVSELYAKLDVLGLEKDVERALGMNREFCSIGALAPDYPYLVLPPSKGTKAWADRMHYQRTGDLVRAGVRWLKANTEPVSDERDRGVAWLLGYAAHVGTDLTIHPVVERKVGPYQGNETEHRRCEMHQDVWIWQRMNLGRVEQSEYFDAIMRPTTGPDGGLLHPVDDLWRAMLGGCFPDETAVDPPRCGDWHRGYRRVIDAAEETARLFAFARHLLDGEAFGFPLPAEIEQGYILDLETPEGAMDYGVVFDRAVVTVAGLWGTLSDALAATGPDDVEAALERFPDANLDTGRDIATGKLLFWRDA